MADLKGRRGKVVLGLSGGLNSFVAAYLLKIQNYDLLGVTVLSSWEDFNGEQGKILSCHIDQKKLDEIKEFCGKLGIPHLPVKVTEFQDKIIESWLSSKVVGELPTQCWSCHELRMDTLYKTMLESGSGWIATGHFAKVLRNDQTKEVSVHASNNELEDQSALISRLSSEVLSKLILPLSDLSQKEVLKLAQNFGIAPESKTLKMHDCLSLNQELDDYINAKLPNSFLKPGDIVFEEQNYGHHSGIHHYQHGEAFESAQKSRNEKMIIADFNFSNKNIILKNESFLRNKQLQLLNCHFADGLILLEPFKGYLSLKDERNIECWVTPKTLNSVYLELSSEHKLLSGEIVTVLNKKGKNSKILLTGEVKLLPKAIEEGEENGSKVNYRIDF